MILERQDLAVGRGEVEIVGPGALATEEGGRHRFQPVVRGIVEDPLVGDVCAIVENETDGAAVAIARRSDRAAGPEDHAVGERLTVSGVVIDPLAERPIGEGNQPEHGVLTRGRHRSGRSAAHFW